MLLGCFEYSLHRESNEQAHVIREHFCHNPDQYLFRIQHLGDNSCWADYDHLVTIHRANYTQSIPGAFRDKSEFANTLSIQPFGQYAGWPILSDLEIYLISIRSPSSAEKRNKTTDSATDGIHLISKSLYDFSHVYGRSVLPHLEWKRGFGSI